MNTQSPKNKPKKTKPKYTMWQNTAFMLRNAWNGHKSVLALVLLLAVLSAANTAAQMLVVPIILDKLETSAPMSELIVTIVVSSLLLLLLSGLIAYLNNNTIFERVTIRLKLMDLISVKAGTTSYSNTLDTNFLRLLNASFPVLGSNDKAAEHIWQTLTNILTDLIGFSIYLALLSNLHALLILLIIVTTVISYFSRKYIEEYGYRNKAEKDKLTTQTWYIYNKSLQRECAKDIRIFGLRDWLVSTFDSARNLYQVIIAKEEKVYLLANIIDLAITFLRNGFAYAYILHLTLTQGLSAAEFLLYISAATGFTTWVNGIMLQFSQLHRESLELCVIREALDYPEPFRFEGGIPLDKNLTNEYRLELKNVSFRYPEAKENTISNMNLVLKPREKVAIVGLNGAGKTTLVKLLCGLLDPTEGEVLLNGQDIRAFNRSDYYRMFSAVFQEFSIMECTIAQNVAQRLTDIDYNLVKTCIEQAGLTDKVASLPKGLETPVGRRVYEDGIELSGGQTQRLILARALYKNAPILVLDEPTAALDPIAENDIYMKYSEMTDGHTSLFISHRLASTRFCDRILFLENGQITEEGTHESLLALGKGYASLFQVQSKYYQEGADNDETEN